MSLRAMRSALAFLTVIPLAERTGAPADRLGRAYFPAVGALLGLVSGLVFILVGVMTTPLLAAAAAVAVMAVLTGGLHLDGLADTADGLLGGGSRERQLEIMRDPRLGAFGAIALILFLISDVGVISALPPARALPALIVAGALSRWAMLWLVALVPYVRPSGLGVAASGDHRAFDLVLGSAVAAIACLLDWRRAALALVLVALTAAGVGAFGRARIGGATGDVYGAATELCWLAALVTFVVHA